MPTSTTVPSSLRPLRRLATVLAAVAMVMVSCTPSESDSADDPDTGQTNPDSGEGYGDCTMDPDGEYNHVDFPLIAPDAVLVENGAGSATIDTAQRLGVPDGDVFDLEDRDEAERLFAVRYDPGVWVDQAGQAVEPVPSYFDGLPWQALAARYDVVTFPTLAWTEDAGLDASPVVQVVAELVNQGLEARPIHTIGYSNHFGGFPGISPMVCTGVEHQPVPSPLAQNVTVGIVDNGFFSVVNPLGFVERSSCQIAHGEFVADVIRQLDDSAQVYGTNAFQLKTAGGDVLCATTDVVGVFRAVSELTTQAEVAGLQFDRLNLSLGAMRHLDLDPGDFDPEFGPASDPAILFDPATFTVDGSTLVELLKMSASTETALVFAAAGNDALTDEIYPAVDPDVIGVATASVDSSTAIVWDDTETPLPFDLPSDSILAPGCDLAAIATEPAGERTLWGGSSFATAVATAIGATGQADVDNFIAGSGMPTTLHGPSIPETGRCA